MQRLGMPAGGFSMDACSQSESTQMSLAAELANQSSPADQQRLPFARCGRLVSYEMPSSMSQQTLFCLLGSTTNAFFNARRLYWFYHPTL